MPASGVCAAISKYSHLCDEGPMCALLHHCTWLQVLDLIHHLDVLESLIAEGVTSRDEWAWSKQFRYYRVSDTVVTANMAGAVLDYSWEYQGNAPKLVHTPLTDKCYLTLTQVTVLCLL